MPPGPGLYTYTHTHKQCSLVGVNVDSIHCSVTKEKYSPLPIDSPLLFERIVLELSTFSAKETTLLSAGCLHQYTVYLPSTSVWLWLLTHYDNGVPATAREVRYMVEGTKDGPRHGGAYLWTKSFIGRHPKPPVSCISPCKDLIVWKKQKQMMAYPQDQMPGTVALKK